MAVWGSGGCAIASGWGVRDPPPPPSCGLCLVEVQFEHCTSGCAQCSWPVVLCIGMGLGGGEGEGGLLVAGVLEKPELSSGVVAGTDVSRFCLYSSLGCKVIKRTLAPSGPARSARPPPEKRFPPDFFFSYLGYPN